MAQHAEHRGPLVRQLMEGFDALSTEYALLAEQHRQLENKLSWAKQQHLELRKRLDQDKADSEQQVFLEELDEAGSCQQNGRAHWLEELSRHTDVEHRTNAYRIREAEQAYEKLRAAQDEQTNGVKIWKGPSADTSQIASSLRLPLHTARCSPLERDFTTPGTPSRLGCPFNRRGSLRPSNNRQTSNGPHSLPTPMSSRSQRSRRSSFVDPIAADMCGNDVRSASAPSVEGSNTAVCPIRFLDQHSPEEVAKFFENHKHELPRSHEECVKRFQDNAESLRQLDAKYGNLVSMIQDLGSKHQAWGLLPEVPDENNDASMEVKEAQASKENIQKWAKTVRASAHGEEADVEDNTKSKDEAVGEDRESRFDRPLKEIRVGESPSRPWGIQVPLQYEKAASAVSSVGAGAANRPEVETEKVRVETTPGTDTKARPLRCPFGHDGPRAKPTPSPETKRVHESPKIQAQPAIFPPPQDKPPQAGPKISAQPQMVFTGPVFIGYPIEQAISILQQSGWNANMS